MKTAIAPVKNLRRLSEIGDALVGRAAGTPGIGVVWGTSGYGKSTAVAWYVVNHEAIHVRAFATWTPSSMLSSILRELGLDARGSCAAMTEQIVSALAQRGLSLFVDEADYLLTKKLLETLRDLHDASTMPLVLVGMHDFVRKVRHHQQFSNRVLHWVEFQAADLEDARALADAVCEVEIADDLLAQLHNTVRGSMREMGAGLARVETWARRHDKRRVTAKDWGNQLFTFNGGGK